ncbi:MAG: hypothetical protein IJP86_12115 [Synergistaceae bacterium]|nr:hypothetical protein [Synergistaceae bacterium]
MFAREAYVLYRQHSSNTSHVPLTFSRRLRDELKKMHDAKGWQARFASQLLSYGGGEIPPSSRRTLKIVSGHRTNFLYRLVILFSPKFRTGDIRLTLVGKFKALLGWL